jgi:hypothetical protein
MSSLASTVATGYVDNAQSGLPVKKAVVRGLVFEPLQMSAPGLRGSETISMNDGMRPRDARRRDPIEVYDFNMEAGRNFKVYYPLEAPATVASCQDTRPDIGVCVCRAHWQVCLRKGTPH